MAEHVQYIAIEHSWQNTCRLLISDYMLPTYWRMRNMRPVAKSMDTWMAHIMVI